MKQTNLLKTFLLLCALVVGSTCAWAADVEIATATFNGKNVTCTDGWSCTGTGINRTDCWVIGKDENITSPAFDLTDYSKVTITFSGRRYGSLSGSKATVDASIGEVSLGTIDITNKSVGAVTGDINFVPTEAMTAAVLVFTCTNATSEGSTHGAGIATITIMGTPKSGGGETTKVATPVFTPGGNTYNVVQNVEITCDTEGATIHYTTNGNDPTESDAAYSTAISVTKSGTVLKARAFKSGLTDSNIAIASYTIKPTKPTITAPGTTVTISGPDGCDIYYTINGDSPTKESTKYTAPFELDADCTIKAKAYDTYDNGSDIASLTYKYFPLTPKNINSGYYEKITDVSDLENGDAILIVNEENEVAMSTTQNSNNRGEENVTISSGIISLPSADVQKLVLVKTTAEIESVETDVFYFYTGSGYLYASSGSSNQLKTEDTPDNNNNARATISISSGNATITFTGNNTHNLIQYNSSSTIFSCYGSASQGAVQIYREVAHNETFSPAKTYTTLTSAYALDFTGSDLRAYIATEIAENKVQMIQVNKVPAGTGLVLKATTPGSAVNVPVFDGTGADNVAANKMAGSATETTAIAANAGYILSDGVFQPASAGTLAAGKAYLAIAAGARALEMSFDEGEVTAIETVKSEKANNEYFNLAGQRVANPTKGLYIVNGRKVVVK